ncbi:MAG TPA: DUF2330 domain-containing protein, partial [Polyangiaceae bacterium]|nr:DUF2330 domain-containing protein [Polyangiaceae bacterium]
MLVSSAAIAVALATTPEAEACGGFFCSAVQPVNQAAERIIFSNNGDGTVTAVIQILYEGPSEKFSWLLPISTVPKQDSDIGVASNLAFQRLQSATNPQYNLNTRLEGTCKQLAVPGAANAGGGGRAAAASGGSTSGPPPDVVVEASGVVGAFEWTVISINESTADPSDAATKWLTDNGYDVPEGAKGLLRPYLEDGLYLLALRLTKGSTTGSIRPISLTYEASKPMIPIKLTAVAANQNMGVMTWLLSTARGVPQNYYSLELNEARINWFNANSNYNDVVNEAADSASGHGFVTEMAGSTERLKNVVWTTFEDTNWSSFRSGTFQNLGQLYSSALSQWGSFDGFDDAARSTIQLPDGVQYSDLRTCPSCYQDQIKFS